MYTKGKLECCGSFTNLLLCISADACKQLSVFSDLVLVFKTPDGWYSCRFNIAAPRALHSASLLLRYATVSTCKNFDSSIFFECTTILKVVTLQRNGKPVRSIEEQ